MFEIRNKIKDILTKQNGAKSKLASEGHNARITLLVKSYGLAQYVAQLQTLTSGLLVYLCTGPTSSSIILYHHSLFTPLYATRGSFGSGNTQRSRALFVHGSIETTSCDRAIFFYTLLRHTWVLAKRPRLFTGYTGPMDPRRDLTTQKVRVANKNHEKSNIVTS